ncbi:flippase [Hafnia paralvei]|uniref:flippase n=1 Tax=Hafnia paralvei TaxID=546367 RepID=UPI000DF47DB9|nr:flippase [Hafnia paralvei]MBU2673992.1 flippase [Hafnia paralvei]RDA70567.1 flippase [Hafnia paralvei]RDA71394.1 flippase [Hafnia paralvei]RDA71446.1 flippase [Hafnia paralvei]RDA80631.1 flippase [Hafnia paralvei]
MAGLKRNIFSLYVLQGSNYLIPLMVFPYLVRVLGPAEYGRIGLATTVVQYLCLFVDFGFNLTASRAIARGHKTKSEISQIFWETMYAKFILLVLSVLFIFVFSNSILMLKDISGLLNILCLQLIGSLLLPVWFFQGIEKMSSVTVSYVMAKGLSIPLVFVFVKKDTDVNAAALIQGGTAFLAGCIAILFVFKTKLVVYKKIETKQITNALRISLPIFIGGVAMSLYTLGTPFILGAVSSIEQVGVYVASDKLRQALMGVFLILGSALYPRVNTLYSESRTKGFCFVKKIILYQGGMALIASILFFILSSVISDLMLGSQYKDSILILKLMSPMIFLIVMSVILCNYVLLPLGHNKIYAKIPIFTGCLHLIYAIQLGRLYGAIGASIAILITELITFIILVLINYKKGYLKEIWR